MRTILIRQMAVCLTLVSLTACPYLTVQAKPSQGGIAPGSRTTETDLRTKSETEKTAKAPVLARNTTPKTETAPAPQAKEQKTHDKKTIDRCWKRLMNMIREVNHAHKSKTK